MLQNIECTGHLKLDSLLEQMRVNILLEKYNYTAWRMVRGGV